MENAPTFSTAVSHICFGSLAQLVFRRNRDVANAKKAAAPGACLAGSRISRSGGDEGVHFLSLSEQCQCVHSRLTRYGECLSAPVNTRHMQEARADRKGEPQQTQAGSGSKRSASLQSLVQSFSPKGMENSAHLPPGHMHCTTASVSPGHEGDTLLSDLATVALLPAATRVVRATCSGSKQRAHRDGTSRSNTSCTVKTRNKGQQRLKGHYFFPNYCESSSLQAPLSTIERGSCRALSGENHVLGKHTHSVGVTAFFCRKSSSLISYTAARCARLLETCSHANHDDPVPEGERSAAVKASVQRIALLLLFCCLLRSHSSPPSAGPVGSCAPGNGRSVALFYVEAQPAGTYPGVNLDNRWGAAYSQWHPEYRQSTPESRVGLPNAHYHFPLQAPRGGGQPDVPLEGFPATHATGQRLRVRQRDPAQQYTEQLLSSIKQHYTSPLEDNHLDALSAPAEHLRPSPEQLQLEFATRLHIAQQDQDTQPSYRPFVEIGTVRREPADLYSTSYVNRPDLQQYEQVHTTPDQHHTKQQVYVPHYHIRRPQLQEPAQGHSLPGRYRIEQQAGAPPVQQYSTKPYVTQDPAPSSNNELFKDYSGRVRPTVNKPTEELLRPHLQPYGDAESEIFQIKEPYILPVEYEPVGVRVSSQPPQYLHWHNAVTSDHHQDSWLPEKTGQLNVSAESRHSQRPAGPLPQPYVDQLHNHHDHNPGVAERPHLHEFAQHTNFARDQDYSRPEDGNQRVQQGALQGINTAQVTYGGSQSYVTSAPHQPISNSRDEGFYQQQQYAATGNALSTLPPQVTAGTPQHQYYPQQSDTFHIQEDPGYKHPSAEQHYTQAASHRQLEHYNSQSQKGNIAYPVPTQEDNIAHSATTQQENSSYSAPAPQVNTSYSGSTQQGYTGKSASTQQGDTRYSAPPQQQSTSYTAPAQQENTSYVTSAHQEKAGYSISTGHSNGNYPTVAQQRDTLYNSGPGQHREGNYSAPVQQENPRYTILTQRENANYPAPTEQDSASYLTVAQQGSTHYPAPSQQRNGNYPASAQHGTPDYPGLAQRWNPPQKFPANTPPDANVSSEHYGLPTVEESRTSSTALNSNFGRYSQEPKQQSEYHPNTFLQEEDKRSFKAFEQVNEPQHRGHVRRRLLQCTQENKTADTSSASFDSNQQSHPQIDVASDANGLPVYAPNQFENGQNTGVRHHITEHLTVSKQAPFSQADRRTEEPEAPVQVAATATRRHLEVAPGDTHQGVSVRSFFEQGRRDQQSKSEPVQREVRPQDISQDQWLDELSPEELLFKNQQQEDSAQQQGVGFPIDTNEEEDNAGTEPQEREHPDLLSSAHHFEKHVAEHIHATARRLSTVEPSTGFDYYAALDELERERYLLLGKPVAQQKGTTVEPQRIGVKGSKQKRNKGEHTTSDEASSELEGATSEGGVETDEDDESESAESEEDHETNGSVARLDRKNGGDKLAVRRADDGETYNEEKSEAGVTKKLHGRQTTSSDSEGENQEYESANDVAVPGFDIESEDEALENDDESTESDKDTNDDRDEYGAEAIAQNRETRADLHGLKEERREQKQAVVEKDDEHNETAAEASYMPFVKKAVEKEESKPTFKRNDTPLLDVDSVKKEEEESKAVAEVFVSGSDGKPTEEENAKTTLGPKGAPISDLNSLDRTKEREIVAEATVFRSEEVAAHEESDKATAETDANGAVEEEEREAALETSDSKAEDQTAQEPNTKTAVKEDSALVLSLDGSKEERNDTEAVVEASVSESAQERSAKTTIEDSTSTSDLDSLKEKSEESDAAVKITDFESDEKTEQEHSAKTAVEQDDTPGSTLDSSQEEEREPEAAFKAAVSAFDEKTAGEQSAKATIEEDGTPVSDLDNLKEKEEREAVAEASVSGSVEETTQDERATTALEKDDASLSDSDNVQENKGTVAEETVFGSEEDAAQEGCKASTETDANGAAEQKVELGVSEEAAFGANWKESAGKFGETAVADSGTLDVGQESLEEKTEASVNVGAGISGFESEGKATNAKDLDSLIDREEERKEALVEATVPRPDLKKEAGEVVQTAGTDLHDVKGKSEEHKGTLVETTTTEAAKNKEEGGGTGITVERDVMPKTDLESSKGKEEEEGEFVAETLLFRFVESAAQQHGRATRSETGLNSVKEKEHHREVGAEAVISGADSKEAEEELVEITAQRGEPTTDSETVKKKEKKDQEAAVGATGSDYDEKANEGHNFETTAKEHSGLEVSTDGLKEKEEKHEEAAAHWTTIKLEGEGSDEHDSETVSSKQRTTVESVDNVEERHREDDGEALMFVARVEGEAIPEATGSKEYHNKQKDEDIERKQPEERNTEIKSGLAQVDVDVQEGAPLELRADATNKSRESGEKLEYDNLPQAGKDVYVSPKSEWVVVDGQAPSGQTQELEPKLNEPGEKRIFNERESDNADVNLTDASAEQASTEASRRIYLAKGDYKQQEEAEEKPEDQEIATDLYHELKEHSVRGTDEKGNITAAKIQSQVQEHAQKDAAEPEKEPDIDTTRLQTNNLDTTGSNNFIEKSEEEANEKEVGTLIPEVVQQGLVEDREILREDAPPPKGRQSEEQSGEKNDSKRKTLKETRHDQVRSEEPRLREADDREVEGISGVEEKPRTADIHDPEEKAEKELTVKGPTQAAEHAELQDAKLSHVAAALVDGSLEKGRATTAAKEKQEDGRTGERESLQTSGTPLETGLAIHGSQRENQAHTAEELQKGETVNFEKGFENQEEQEASTAQKAGHPKTEQKASAEKGEQTREARQEQGATPSEEKKIHENTGRELVEQQPQITSVQSEGEKHTEGREGQKAEEGDGEDANHTGLQVSEHADETEGDIPVLKEKGGVEKEEQIEETAKEGRPDAKRLQITPLQGEQGGLSRARADSQEGKVAYNPLSALVEGAPVGLWRGPHGGVTENPPFESLPSYTAGETTAPGRARRHSPLSWALKEKGVAAAKQGDGNARSADAKGITEDSDFDGKENSISTARGEAVAKLLPHVPGLIFPASPSARQGKPGSKETALATKGQRQGHVNFRDADRDPTISDGKESELKEDKAQFSPTLNVFREKVDHEDTLFGSENGALDPIAYSTLPPGAAAKRLKRHRKRDWKLKAAARAAKKKALKETAKSRRGEPVPTKDLPPALAVSAATEGKQAQPDQKRAAEENGEETKEVATEEPSLKEYKPGMLAHQAAEAAAAGGKGGSGAEAYLLLPRQSERIAAADVTTASSMHIDNTVRTVEHPGTTPYIRKRRAGPTVGPGPAAFLPRFLYRPQEVEPTLTLASGIEGSTSTAVAPNVEAEEFEVVPAEAVSEPEAPPIAEESHTNADKIVELPATYTLEPEEPVSAGAALTNSRLATTLSQQSAAAEQPRFTPQQQQESAFGEGERRKQNNAGVRQKEDTDPAEESFWEDADKLPAVHIAEPKVHIAAGAREGSELQNMELVRESAAVTTTSFSIAVTCGPLFSVGWLLFSL